MSQTREIASVEEYEAAKAEGLRVQIDSICTHGVWMDAEMEFGDRLPANFAGFQENGYHFRAILPEAPAVAADTASAELRALSEKATPGEWDIGDGESNGAALTIYCDQGWALASTKMQYTCIPAEQDHANAAFIVACVNHVRAALGVAGQEGETK